MACSDPFLSYLKAFGYNPIRFPKADVRPLQILTGDKRALDRLGELATVLVTGTHIPLPVIDPDKPAADINGQSTSDLSIGIGLSILGTVIGAMGGSTLGVDASYKQAKTITFEFHDVLTDSIEVAKLDQYLADADVSPFSRYVGELLEAEEIYVISATIKSSKFTTEAKSSNGTSLQVKVPDIQGVVGENVKVSGDASATARITYEGKTPLVFGFQAVQLFYDQGRYTRLKPLQPGATGAKALARAPKDGSERLVTPGAFVRLSTE